MSKIAKVVIGVIVLILIIGIAWFMNNDQAPKEIIKIGVLAPLSGPSSVIGEKIRKGVNDAVSEINKDSKIIDVIFEDNKNEGPAAISGAKKLLEMDKVDILFTSMSGPSLAVVGIAKEKNIPLIATVVYADVTPQYKNALQFYISAKSEANALYNFSKKVSLGKMGLLYLVNDYGVAIKNSIESSMNASSSIVSEGYAMSDITFKTPILKLISNKVDTIYAITFPQTAATIIKEIRELGFKGKIITNAPIYLNGLIGTSDYYNNTYTSSPTSYAVSSKIDSFEKKFGSKYPAGNAYIPYDILKIIGNEIKNGVSVDNLVDSISTKGSIETSANGKITIDKETRIAEFPLEIVLIKNGVIESVK
jgi:ABC-type branched-subunit amino acid transport system substrate-binding protein